MDITSCFAVINKIHADFKTFGIGSEIPAGCRLYSSPFLAIIATVLPSIATRQTAEFKTAAL